MLTVVAAISAVALAPMTTQQPAYAISGQEVYTFLTDSNGYGSSSRTFSMCGSDIEMTTTANGVSADTITTEWDAPSAIDCGTNDYDFDFIVMELRINNQYDESDTDNDPVGTNTETNTHLTPNSIITVTVNVYYN